MKTETRIACGFGVLAHRKSLSAVASRSVPETAEGSRLRYSPLEHIGRAIWGTEFGPKNLFAMFTAYFDESGTSSGSAAVTVAGSVSSIQKWERLAPQWCSILKKRGLSVFHMQECAAGRNKYKGWSSQNRRTLVYELCECMASHVKYAWSCNIVLDCWNLVNEDFEMRENFGTPYCLASAICVYAVKAWANKKPNSPAVEYVFEDGALGRGEMIERVQRNQGVAPILKPKALPGLQVADLIAWKTRRLLHDMVSDPLSMTASDYNASIAPIRRVPSNYFVLETKKLTTMCERMGVPLRRRKGKLKP